MSRPKRELVLAVIIIAIVTVSSVSFLYMNSHAGLLAITTNETSVPNFLYYIYLDGLMSIKPESVNILH